MTHATLFDEMSLTEGLCTTDPQETRLDPRPHKVSSNTVLHKQRYTVSHQTCAHTTRTRSSVTHASPISTPPIAHPRGSNLFPRTPKPVRQRDPTFQATKSQLYKPSNLPQHHVTRYSPSTVREATAAELAFVCLARAASRHAWPDS